MRVMSIEFRTGTGDRFDLALAFKHTTGYSFSLIFMPLHVISVISIVASERRQSLIDHVLGTVAINKPAGH
ncbi:MAG: RDD family protein, partial [Pseudomonadota bacterium]